MRTMNMPRSTLPAPLDAERFEIAGRAGRLVAFVAGEGPPLLLVHSVNAAASAAELRPLHEHHRRSRTVFSIDLPGYGLSERSDREYTPRLMTDAVLDLLDLVRARCGAAPVDALALSLGCEFLARAAVEQPDAFRSLAFVSPTGLAGGKTRRGPPGSTLKMAWLLTLLRGPGWGGALFRGLTRPGVIRYFLERTWGAKTIDEELWRYDVLTTRQPGAEYAPLHFLSGALFSADIQDVYERIAVPVWMSHGVRGDFTDYRAYPTLSPARPWRVAVYETGAFPHFERADTFCADHDAFLAST